MRTKQPATPRSPAASVASGAPSSTAPTTAKALEDTFGEIDIKLNLPTKIDMTRQPVAEVDYSQYPEKTRREMVAGKAALNKTAEMTAHVSELMTQTAQEMFSKQAKERLLAKHKVDLTPGTVWSAVASLDAGKQEWSVTITIRRPGAPPAELTEPFVQFPSDEMIAWLMMTG